MKIVGLEIQHMEIVKFFPSKHEVELGISFSDGANQQATMIINSQIPEKEAERIVVELKEKVAEAHRDGSSPNLVDAYVNIVVKEEDKLKVEIPQYLTRVHSQLERLVEKKDADGYLDLVRELKNMKLKLA